MDFKKSILWSGRLYKLLEKINLSQNLNIDNFIDSNLPQILSRLQSYAKKSKIAICQTNGKKTTANILNQIILKNNETLYTNITKEGKRYPTITSILLEMSSLIEKNIADYGKDYYVMALNDDELDYYFNTIKFDYLLLGNIFIDQKNFISLEQKREKIKNAIALNSKLNLIINADEPFYYQIDEIKNDVLINNKRNKFLYGFNNIEIFNNNIDFKQENDLLICPICSCKLDYTEQFYSHIGKYDCDCGFKRPELDLCADAKIFNNYCFLTTYYKNNKMVFKLPFGGLYNAYNALGAISVALNMNIQRKTISDALDNYENLRARDDVFEYKNKTIKIKTIKNPTSLTSAIEELYGNKNTKVVFCLNSSKKDGIDTSWIWNSNFEALKNFENKIYICSNRFDEMALRLKYAQVNPSLLVMDASIKNSIQCCYWELEKNESMLILTVPSLINKIYNILKK